MTAIPEDVMIAARRTYDALGRGSISDSERIALAILAERTRLTAEIEMLWEKPDWSIINATYEKWKARALSAEALLAKALEGLRPFAAIFDEMAGNSNKPDDKEVWGYNRVMLVRRDFRRALVEEIEGQTK